MDVSKLEVGMRVKNYKELCELLGENVKTGGSKSIQLKNLERYIKYSKDKHSFIVDEIYDKPLPKVDGRKNPVRRTANNSKYSADIQPMIINLLAAKESGQVFLPANQMFAMIDMVNINFKPSWQDIKALAEITNVPVKYAHDFFSVTNTELRKKLESALRSLRNKALIIWEKSVTVCTLISEEEYNQFGDIVVNPQDEKYGKIKYHKVHREATKDEKQFILKTEKRVMLEMKCSSLQHIFLAGRWEEFQSKVRAFLKEDANILYYYDSYKITVNEEAVKSEDDRIRVLEAQEKLRIGTNLNKNICQMLVNNADTLHKRAISKEKPNIYEELHATKKYTQYNKILNDTVINKEAKDIREEIKIKTKELIADGKIKKDKCRHYR